MRGWSHSDVQYLYSWLQRLIATVWCRGLWSCCAMQGGVESVTGCGDVRHDDCSWCSDVRDVIDGVHD
jgi:hypothetical protein